MQEYYIAAQLNSLVCCCDSTYTANWKQLEILQSPIQSLLGDDNEFKEISENNITQWTKCGLELWYKLMIKFKLEYQMRILS